MNTKTPTHDEIALHAQHLWQDRGCPAGIDTEIWLEAERQLNGNKSTNPTAARASAEMAAESVVEYHISPAVPQQEAIQAAIQKQAARAPQVPTHTGRKVKPPETGKPVWSKPHSS
jgi:hypothetical protein